MYIDQGAISRRTFLVLSTGAATVFHTALYGKAGHALAKIIRLNTVARGGAAALDRMRSVAIDVEIIEGGETLTGRYAANTEGLVRIDIYADGKWVFSEGIDSVGAWTWPGKGSAKMGSDAGRVALLVGAEKHLFGWHRFAGRGNAITLMPPAFIDGRDYSVVQIRYAAGQSSYFYIDPLSWQIVRKRDERAYHPDVDPMKQKVETRFSGFRAVGGIVEPDLDEDYDLFTGKLIATHRILARQVNPALPSDYFDRSRQPPASWERAPR